MNRSLCLIGVGWAALVAGCRSPAGPHYVVEPAPPPVAPQPAVPPPAPSGVYRAPQIGKVFLRAHVDANGRLFGPQVVYQIVAPGGWNLDAMEPADPEPRRATPTAAAPRFETDAGWLIRDSSPPNPGTTGAKDP